MATPPSPPASSLAAKSGDYEASEEFQRYVTKFEDWHGLVLPYCNYFEFELYPDTYDWEKDENYDRFPGLEVVDTNHVKDPVPTLCKYVAQIRRSFGFDVDCVAPSWFQGVFVPFDLTEDAIKYPKYYKKVLQATEFAMTEINSDTMKMSGETYELVELVKLVRGRPWRKLLTLKVKGKGDGGEVKTIQAIVYEEMDLSWSLIQWRFKPVDDKPWYEPPPIEKLYPFLKSKAADAATDASASASASAAAATTDA